MARRWCTRHAERSRSAVASASCMLLLVLLFAHSLLLSHVLLVRISSRASCHRRGADARSAALSSHANAATATLMCSLTRA